MVCSFHRLGSSLLDPIPPLDHCSTPGAPLSLAPWAQACPPSCLACCCCWCFLTAACTPVIQCPNDDSNLSAFSCPLFTAVVLTPHYSPQVNCHCLVTPANYSAFRRKIVPFTVIDYHHSGPCFSLTRSLSNLLSMNCNSSPLLLPVLLRFVVVSGPSEFSACQHLRP